MKFYEMESIKMLLGLPANAGARQIEARLSELLSKEEELEGLKGVGQQNKESAKGWCWWRRRS